MESSLVESSAAQGRSDIAHTMNVLRVIVRALRLETRAIERQLGISLAQLFVLQILNESVPKSLAELAVATATHPSSVSVVVKKLVERGLIVRARSMRDRRRVRIKLTDAGRDLLRSAPITVQMKLVRGLRRLSPDQGAQLAMLMSDWLSAAGLDLDLVPSMFMEDGN